MYIKKESEWMTVVFCEWSTKSIKFYQSSTKVNIPNIGVYIKIQLSYSLNQFECKEKTMDKQFEQNNLIGPNNLNTNNLNETNILN